jgi:1-acyl-sn-glycerol-3-phosphate acyltransferase
MIRFFQKTYLYFGFFIFGLFMLVVFPIIGLAQWLLPKEPQEMVKLWCMKFWASSFYTFGIWFYHKGTQKAQQEWPAGPIILVANHNSLLDTPAIYLALRRFALPLAKIELTKAPVFGHLNRWITLAVDRSSPTSRQKAIADMNRYLSEGGSLLIFPEGKTNKTKQPLQAFEGGAFRLSFELGVPIVPILVRNSRHCLAGTKPMILRPGIIQTEAGPVFYPNQFSQFADLQQAVYDWFSDQLA